MQPQTRLDFSDMLWDILNSYNTDPHKTEDAVVNEVRGLVDQLWERAQEDCDLKTSYDEGYEIGHKHGYESGHYDGSKEGYEEAKEKYQVKADQPEIVEVKNKKTKAK